MIMRVSSEEVSAILPVFAERSRRPNTSTPSGRRNVVTHVPEDPIREVCKLTRTARAPCRNRLEARGDRNHHAPKFGDAITADHSILNEENKSGLQHRYAVAVQDLRS